MGYTPENPLAGNVTENIRCVTYRCEGVTVADVREMSDPSYKPEEEVGCMTVIFCEDGTVFLTDFLRNLDYNRYTWIRGALSEDGTEIDIPVGQPFGESHTIFYEEPAYLYPVRWETGENGDGSWAIVEEEEVIKFRICEDGSISPIRGVSGERLGYLTKSGGTGLYALDFTLFELTEEQPSVPRGGLNREVWDFQFYSLGLMRPAYSRSNTVIGKSLGVVFDGDTIYVQGCSYHCPEAWIMGVRKGGTYEFPATQVLAAGYYFVPLDLEIEDVCHSAYTHHNYYFTPNFKDYVMECDSGGDLLYSAEWIRFSYNWEGTEKFDDRGFTTTGDLDLFADVTFRKVPPGPQIPQPPTVSIEECGSGNCEIMVWGSYFDANGYVMNIHNLYYRLYIDGEPFIFTEENCRKYYKGYGPTEYLPYYMTFIELDQVSKPCWYRFTISLDTIPKEVCAEMVFMQDGVEYSSVGTATVDPGEHVTKETYDLLGRKVGEGSLLPGIYVRGGKKILIK